MAEQHTTIIPQIIAKQEKVYNETMCRIKDWMLVFLKEVETLGENIINIKDRNQSTTYRFIMHNLCSINYHSVKHDDFVAD